QVWEWGPGTGGAPTGAGQGVRRENPVTGFDPFDDVSLGALRAEGADGRVTALRYQGPYPLFNAALNLVAGDELAVQDRRAASFVLSPGYCGSEETGFAATPTADGDRANLTLGRAMTISGAAVDPNMSFHHSPPVTALLTVFNARLGWWLQNPRVPAAAPWAAAPPRGGVLQQLGREFFGLTDEKGSYVHLSDGGHFDNSGVYELIRRRCRFVVAVDAAQDRDDASENLAALVRLVRADFGIRIEIDTTPLRKGPDGLSRWHVAVGLIRYDDVDDHALAGTLVFVRSSLTGDEPSDVRQYAATHPEYPHTSTADQFFDDAQFESYRMLGEHAAVSVFEEAVVAGRTRFDVAELKDDTGHRTAVRELFAAVRNRWFPPPPAFDQNYADAGHECARLMSQIRTDPNLDGFAHALYPELPPEAGGAPGADAAPADALGRPHELLAVNQMLDVMERAWLGIQLGTYHAHPMHRGWMNAFRRWTSSATFRRVWPVVRGEFSKDFVRFCERALNLPPVRAVPRPVASDAELERVRQLDAEFLREWGQQFGRVREQEAGRSAAAHPLLEQLAAAPEQDGYLTAAVRATRGEWPGEPLAWLLYLSELRPDGTDAVIDRLQDFPVGLLAVTPRPGPGPGYEIVFWVRPAYRSLNLGRSAIEYPEGGVPGGEKLYLKIRRLLRERYPEKDIILRAHYPTSAAVGGDRLQRALWINFFHDYDFRRVREPADGPFITVEYTVRPAG
ncbi:hypothetical protein J0H58_17585, partial [bacterium]|nr:hypothetical protein [bacterium]